MPDDPTVLSDTEAQLLITAAGMDTGALAEGLANLAHAASFQADVTASELRQLAAIALTCARRLDAAEQ